MAISYANVQNPKDNFTFKCHRSNGVTNGFQDIYAVNDIAFHPVHGKKSNFDLVQCMDFLVSVQFFDTIELTNLTNGRYCIACNLLLSKVHFTDLLKDSNTSQWIQIAQQYRTF